MPTRNDSDHSKDTHAPRSTRRPLWIPTPPCPSTPLTTGTTLPPIPMTRLLYCLVLATACSCALHAAAERPNFIFIITDDISADDLGPYGNTVVQTPNLDRIAAAGLVFDNAYVTISSCSPSRCSIITGRYPHNTGAPELHTTLPKDQTTFVQVLREAGYHTVLSGKNHMGKPENLGFVESSDSRPAGSENWVRHLRERPKDRPFFCWFASHDAHHDWQFDDKAPRYDPAEVEVPPMLFDGPGTRQELADYYHDVSRTDHYAGAVMAELEAQGIAENTYFIYCADNGRPFPRCKAYLYESGIQTPLIVSGPGVAAGRTGSLASSVDYAATILDLAGIDPPATLQGVSLAPVLADPSASTRDYVFAERNWHVYQNHERAVRSGDFLYIWNAYPERHNVSGEASVTAKFPAAKEIWEQSEAGGLTPAQAIVTQLPLPEVQLYNVRSDPAQLANLAGDPAHAPQLAEMRALLGRWVEETGDSVPANPTPDRQPLHGLNGGNGGKTMRGEFPGAANNATQINHPGPVKASPEP